jgi:hypothetical protein
MFGAQQNVRMADLAPSRIGDADDGRLENGRMRQKSALDLGGIDVLAAGGPRSGGGLPPGEINPRQWGSRPPLPART